MNTQHTFAQLARNAEAVGRAMAVTYRTDYLDGKEWKPVGDTFANFDAAYDDYVEAHKHWSHADLICWEISADGMATDVTDRMIYEAEILAEQRGYELDWEE